MRLVAGGVQWTSVSNEGVMPQTREHLAIADLVGVRGGVCALSLIRPPEAEMLRSTEKRAKNENRRGLSLRQFFRQSMDFSDLRN